MHRIRGHGRGKEWQGQHGKGCKLVARTARWWSPLQCCPQPILIQPVRCNPSNSCQVTLKQQEIHIPPRQINNIWTWCSFLTKVTWHPIADRFSCWGVIKHSFIHSSLPVPVEPNFKTAPIKPTVLKRQHRGWVDDNQINHQGEK